MRRLLSGLLPVACWLLCLPLAGAAERVVSLAPSLTEMMLELGAADQLVGVVDGAARPAVLAQLPAVGRHDQLELETLLNLQPDLLLAWSDSLSGERRRQLQRLGIPLFEMAPRSLADLGAALVALGERVGRAEQGQRLGAQFARRVQALRQQYRRQPSLRVFYQVWERPLYTLGGRQIISDALQVCGARNVFAGLDLPAPQVSVEAVLQANPAVILLSTPQQAAAWQAWPQLAAVQRQQVWTIPDAGLERPSLQMLDAVEKLCRQLQQAR
ncbi:cobalamin-binding protein [Pseudomonas sp. N040]|uniref:cobalamin-binding protein n=1 Tax=Pseudomonas sp. N040 TaxID=2785325 RepID=UPI0018A2EBE3|nr:cobalamin-binding protein [Pseudomonas sp. N040]MBF7730912.1 cobalamin-binding protein [Pseudomonas sp. N040]MBW7014555.1 cobalamin-binding protein [Pseudomonas sp. N040]